MLRMWTVLLGAVLVACTDGSNSFRDTGRAETGGLLDGTGDGRGLDTGTGSDGNAREDERSQPDSGDDGGVIEGDVVNLYDTGSAAGDACVGTTCTGRPLGCVATEICGNGLDDNCDRNIDEGCPCLPGTVQDCFPGPPGLRGIGACHDGSQRCTGAGEFGTWSACMNGISPGAEVCDNLDNDCNGCMDEGDCCRPDLMCPAPGDPRVPDGRPFADYILRGASFFPGAARSWAWTVRGGPCEAILPRPTYTITGANSPDLTFRPTLSGDYTVTVTVTRMDGTVVTCTFVVHIAGPGLRVELCWDTSTTVDLDLYLHDPRNTGPWFNNTSGPNTSVNANSCNWSNCEALVRGTAGRVDWGYPRSPLAECTGAPHGADWRALGYCGNPRLDIDNNLAKASGVPENVNADTPRDMQRFRIMVQNFTGTRARPMVNVYCGGHLRATIGAAPDTLPDFTGSSGSFSVGAMWRAADVLVHVDASGATTGCDVTPLHPPGATTGFFVTRNDPSY